jgi:hypothetical protein
MYVHRLTAAWHEIGRDFGWLTLAIVLVYAALSAVINWQSQNLRLFGENSRRLVALVLWLTIVAVTVPNQTIPIPIKKPLPEVTYLGLWGIAIAFFVVYFPRLTSAAPRWTWNIYAIQAVYVLGNIVLAILFASIFRYSPAELGIRLRHWRLYLGLIVLVFPSGWYFGGKTQIAIGLLIIVALFILYRTNTTRWKGLADDLKSLRRYVLPILLCSLVTVGAA